jgi:hypothetical protein
MKIIVLIPVFVLSLNAAGAEKRPHIQTRGIYGGSPVRPGEPGSLADFGVNAIFVHSGSINQDLIRVVKAQNALIFAEFNTLHVKSFLEENPEAAPIGPDGQISPPPHGWQGICPNHKGYRKNRMAEFRRLLKEYALDGIWLDYHHSHASWERESPLLPDTCFCQRCLGGFTSATGIRPAGETTEGVSSQLLGVYFQEWTDWRCDVLTDWVREFHEIIEETRPAALLGTFHCPWSDKDFDGARLKKLAIDLEAQAAYIDVFSPMPYHARFGHADDLGWISRQVTWLGQYLELSGGPRDRNQIWPIVQLSDWGEVVQPGQVAEILDHGSRLPATGLMVFAWGSLRKQPEKVRALSDFYLEIAPRQ